eukprot:15482368-Alexandrium_andersonii.AAC.1
MEELCAGHPGSVPALPQELPDALVEGVAALPRKRPLAAKAALPGATAGLGRASSEPLEAQ